MGDKVTDKIFEYIDTLAQKLGVASEYVFGMLVRQQIIEGITYTVTLLLASAVIWIATYKVTRYASKNWDEIVCGYNELWWFTLIVMLVMIAAVLLIIDIALIPQYIMKIFNPEYYAIKEILDTISGK